MIKNWLLALELEFDPAPDDEGLLNWVIEDKRREFAELVEAGGENAAYYQEAIDAIDAGEAESALLDWAERIDQEKQARKIVYNSINAAIENARLLDPSFSDETAAGVASHAQDAIRSESGVATYELPNELVDARIKRFKELYSQPDQTSTTKLSGEQIDAIYNRYAGVDANEAKRFDGYARDLANVGANDLLDFFAKMGVTNAHTLPPTKLVAAAQAIAQNPPKTLTDPAAIASAVNLAHNAEEVFGSAEKAQEYTRYLDARKLDAVFRGITRYVKKGGEIPRNLAIKQSEELAKCIGNKQDAPAVLAGFARRNNMTMGASYDDLVRALNGETLQQAAPTVVMEEERDSAGKSAARMLSAMPAKTKRLIVIAVLAVIVVVIAFFAISSIVSNVQEQQQAEAQHQAAIDSFGEGELRSLIEEALENEEWPTVITDYNYTQSSARDFAPKSVTITDKQAGDDDMDINFTAVLENSYFEQSTNGSAHLSLDASSQNWVLDTWNFGDSEAHPTRAVNLHQDKSNDAIEYPDADVVFDQQGETCTATYEADKRGWYGGESGKIVYHFSFDGTKWVLDKTDDNLEKSFNSEALVGSYQVTSKTRDKDAHIESFAIESVDSSTGNIVASYTITPEEGASTQSLSGKIEGAITGDGSITLKTSIPVNVDMTCGASSSEGTLSSFRFFAYGTGSSDGLTLQKQ